MTANKNGTSEPIDPMRDLLRGDIEVTLGGEPIHPWWNMLALRRLKKDFGILTPDVLNNVLDPDYIVPFYFVGLESREPGKHTVEEVETKLNFFDLLNLQSKMNGVVKEFGLDAVPLAPSNGAAPGPSPAPTSA